MASTALFDVIQPGMRTTLQDDGRYGQAGLGITTGGAADKLAYYWANRLVGNELGASVLEITLGGLQLKVLHDSIIAVTGANAELTRNAKPLSQWQSHKVNRGDILSLGFAKH